VFAGKSSTTDRPASSSVTISVAHHLAQAAGVADIVLDRLLLILVETGEPSIFADPNRARAHRQPGGERRFSGGDLAADHVERRACSVSRFVHR